MTTVVTGAYRGAWTRPSPCGARDSARDQQAHAACATRRHDRQADRPWLGEADPGWLL